VDEGKPAAAKSIQDRSPLVCIVTTSTPDTDCVGDALVSPVTAGRDLGVYSDAGVTMRT